VKSKGLEIGLETRRRGDKERKRAVFVLPLGNFHVLIILKTSK
jgi:hypothetical protein